MQGGLTFRPSGRGAGRKGRQAGRGAGARGAMSERGGAAAAVLSVPPLGRLAALSGRVRPLMPWLLPLPPRLMLLQPPPPPLLPLPLPLEGRVVAVALASGRACETWSEWVCHCWGSRAGGGGPLGCESCHAGLGAAARRPGAGKVGVAGVGEALGRGRRRGGVGRGLRCQSLRRL